jgi:hypothetical protein
LAGIAFRRGDRGYEQARRGEMWNDRVPERHAEVAALRKFICALR